jgi:hypothetical protein
MMQKLATAMAIERMRKVAMRSSLSAENKFLFISFQSRRRSSGPSGAPSGRSAGS